MSYLEDFKKRVLAEDLQGCLTLWEEYRAGDEVDVPELEKILALLIDSRFSAVFGKRAEEVIPLLEKIEDEEKRYSILRLLLDLQNTHSPILGDLAYQALEKRYGQQPDFQEKIRLIGLRNRIGFQSAIRNFELLEHLAEGRFVYHTGGWGTGEILEVSPVREELQLEFEGVPGRKVLSFENAFNNLRPLPDDHFLARRFGDPDLFEEEARKDPVAVVHMLLRDLGPKTAADVKEELCELVIPEEDWAKWWQSARGRLKRDTRIETPANIRGQFRLREAEMSHLDRMKEALAEEASPDRTLVTAYSFARDFVEISKNAEGKEIIKRKIGELLERQNPTQAQVLQAYALLEDLGQPAATSFAAEVEKVRDLPAVINAMEIVSFKKRVLVVLREQRSDWQALFVDFLFSLNQGALRDYLLKELMSQSDKSGLAARIQQLLQKPAQQPYFFLWYFQKVMRRDEDVLYRDKVGQCHFFEALLILLHQLELLPEYRESVKKIYSLITAGRYQLVRDVLEESPIEFAQEFLLLISKSHTFSPHDVKIMHALAEVVHPSLASQSTREKESEVAEVLWTTEEGYKKLRARLEEIANREMVDNARDLEQAREHGDLRENAEYKAAQERRARLQAELKMLTEQLNHARILTAVDVAHDQVGVGAIVTLVDSKGASQQYTLLGPWDADPDQGVLSFQSRFAQAMAGLKTGETFTYQGQTYRVGEIANFFEAHA